MQRASFSKSGSFHSVPGLHYKLTSDCRLSFAQTKLGRPGLQDGAWTCQWEALKFSFKSKVKERTRVGSRKYWGDTRSFDFYSSIYVLVPSSSLGLRACRPEDEGQLPICVLSLLFSARLYIHPLLTRQQLVIFPLIL